jgi:hypothetical protein
MYVLEGKMVTHAGTFGPGTFVWFPEVRIDYVEEKRLKARNQKPPGGPVGHARRLPPAVAFDHGSSGVGLGADPITHPKLGRRGLTPGCH